MTAAQLPLYRWRCINPDWPGFGLLFRIAMLTEGDVIAINCSTAFLGSPELFLENFEIAAKS